MRNWLSCECKDVSKPSRWSSWPFKQVRTKDKKGWWLRRDELRWTFRSLSRFFDDQFPLSRTCPWKYNKKNFIVPRGENKHVVHLYIQKMWHKLNYLLKVQWYCQAQVSYVHHAVLLTCNFQHSALNSTRQFGHQWSHKPYWAWFAWPQATPFLFLSVQTTTHSSTCKLEHINSCLGHCVQPLIQFIGARRKLSEHQLKIQPWHSECPLVQILQIRDVFHVTLLCHNKE